MKIFVVTRGERFDGGYHIITATTDLAMAQKVKETYSTKESIPSIEMYECSEDILQPLWTVNLSEDGSILSVEKIGYIETYENEVNTCFCDFDGTVCIYVRAESEAIAVNSAKKIFGRFMGEKA